MSYAIGRILTWPLRAPVNTFRRGAKLGGRNGASAGRTAANSGGSAIAKVAGDEILDNEYREEPPSGIEAAMFKQLPRPRLTEKAASDLTLEQAVSYSEQSKRFYEYNFPLFPRGDFFYEEIEEEYLCQALGYDADSIDKRFIDVSTLFRRTLNDNTRSLMLTWAPLIGFLVLGAAAVSAPYLNLAGSGNATAEASILFGAASLAAAMLTFLVYSWPYKVVQQRNLLNLDNYVTSKFARINNNFQVAKRRALNVERDKRMSERDKLKDEAGSWTLAYHWFAVRLFLCETMLRNKFYQLRRNTTLYWVSGLMICGALLAVLAIGLGISGAAGGTIIAFAVSSVVYLAITWSLMSRATGMMFSVLESNEWSRFHIINLDCTIRDHVGEDKLQIVTFRDRNRFE